MMYFIIFSCYSAFMSGVTVRGGGGGGGEKKGRGGKKKKGGGGRARPGFFKDE